MSLLSFERSFALNSLLLGLPPLPPWLATTSGTSPNFLITLASPKSPVAGSPVRLKATAPDVTFLARQRLSAHYSGVWIEAFRGLASGNAVIGGDERQVTSAMA
jgi:hypothetical protein